MPMQWGRRKKGRMKKNHLENNIMKYLHILLWEMILKGQNKLVVGKYK
jgi:hypothetical protein